MGLFLSDNGNGMGLRSEYFEVAAATVEPATAQASSILLCTLQRGARFAYFDNTINVDLSIYLCAPTGDSTITTNRFRFVDLPTNRVLNYDFLQQLQVSFDPGTKIYISKSAGASTASTGKLRLHVFA